MGPSGEIWKWIQREIVSEEAGNLNKAAMIQDTYITAGRKRVSIETGPIIPLVKPRWADNHNVFIDDRIRHLDDIWPSLHYFWSSMFPRPFSSSALDVSCTPCCASPPLLGKCTTSKGFDTWQISSFHSSMSLCHFSTPRHFWQTDTLSFRLTRRLQSRELRGD